MPPKKRQKRGVSFAQGVEPVVPVEAPPAFGPEEARPPQQPGSDRDYAHACNADIHDWMHAGITARGFVDHYTGTWEWFVHHALKVPENFAKVVVPVPTQGVVDIVEVDTRPGRKPRLLPPMMEEADGFMAPLVPYESKMRQQPYTAPLFLNLIHTRRTLNDDGTHGPVLTRTYHDNLTPGGLPCMVGTHLCWRTQRPEGVEGDIGERWDPGGYFLCGDSEKIVTQVLTRRKNYVFVFQDMGRRYKYVAECRPREASRWRATSTVCVRMHEATNHLSVALPFVKMEVPLMAVMRMLGFTTVEQAARCIMTAGMTSGKTKITPDSEFYDPALYNMLVAYMRAETGSKAFTMQGLAKDKVIPDFLVMEPEDIMRWVGIHGPNSAKQKAKTPQEKQDHIRKLMITELFPHIGKSPPLR